LNELLGLRFALNDVPLMLEKHTASRSLAMYPLREFCSCSASVCELWLLILILVQKKAV
jgi:hypothetical protein